MGSTTVPGFTEELMRALPLIGSSEMEWRTRLRALLTTLTCPDHAITSSLLRLMPLYWARDSVSPVARRSGRLSRRKTLFFEKSLSSGVVGVSGTPMFIS